MKKNNLICKLGLVGALFCSMASAHAQMNPVGNWHTIDEKTGEIKSLVVISEANGVMTGTVSKLLRKGADQAALCKECTDDRKDKPMLGLEIIRGAKKEADNAVWSGGKILDPESGKEYTLKLTPVEEGKKLEVRGSIAFFGRTQTWVRAQP